MNTDRQIISLNGEWQFAYTKNSPDISSEDDSKLTVNFPKASDYEVSLPVPAYWDDCKSILKYAKFWARGCVFNPDARRIEEFPLGGSKPPDASLPYLLGTGWYKTYFTADTDWTDKCVELYVGGAMLDAWVWLNGSFIGTYYSCGKPFEFALERFIKPGTKNELIIAVSNANKKRNGCSIRGYKGKSAGIVRSVELRISKAARIEDCYVRATDSSLKKLLWNIRLRKTQDVACMLRWSILLKNGTDVIANGTIPATENNIIFETETFGLKTWSDNHPELYRLQLELLSENDIIDSISQDFGLRFITRKDLKIYANNHPLFLRGATDHAYFPETCTVPCDTAYYMKTIKALKAAGFNWMRFHTTIPPVECIKAADRLGMYIQVETQNGFSEDDFINMIKLCRIHPSVILYCCGNEVPISTAVEEKLETMSRHCHTLVPDCLFDPMEGLFSIEYKPDETAPGYMEKPIPYDSGKLSRVRKYSDVFATAVWVFSYNSLFPDMDFINERLSIYQRPCLIHEAGIFDTYLNLDLEKRYENTRIGTDLFSAVRNYISEMGLLDRAPLYYQNSCRWMKLLMKFALEKSRRCHTIAGYDFLGATDCHWHRSGYAVGVMNEFFELKAGFTTHELNQFNGENILVCDLGHRRNMLTGEKMPVKVFASLYGEMPFSDGTLYWCLKDDKNRVRLSGGEYIKTGIESGTTTEIAHINIGLDEVNGTGEHFRLYAALHGGSYAIDNEWDIWIFNSNRLPDTTAAGVSISDFKISDKLTADDLAYMENGGRILLLGAGPFPELPISFQITPGGRVNGNCSTVVYDHPLLCSSFPHDGFCDWQFAPMFDGGSAVVFNNLDTEFLPIVEIVSTYKMIKKQAAIFELKIGSGGLLVCSLNVLTDDPAAKALYNSMLKYLASDEFAPKGSMATEELLKLINSQKLSDTDFTTDECYDAGGHVEV